MPASTGSHCSRCVSQRGLMVESWGTVLVALASTPAVRRISIAQGGALDLANIGAVEVGPLRQPFLRPAALMAQLPDDAGKALVEAIHIPPPLSSISFLETAWVRKLPGGMLCVSQTLPPIEEPRPMVTRPRMVAPA
jgi:hypothetical protein